MLPLPPFLLLQQEGLDKANEQWVTQKKDLRN